MMTRLYFIAFFVGCLLASAAQANLVINGDFERGDANFVSAYTFDTDPTGAGEYCISINPYLNCPGPDTAWFTDHTSRSGKMLMVNGSSTSDRTVWQQEVAVDPDTDYVFSYFIATWTKPNRPSLRLYINGIQVGISDANAPVTTGSWVAKSRCWNSEDCDSAIIRLVDMQLSDSGNDFALDDICFRPVPPDLAGNWMFDAHDFGVLEGHRHFRDWVGICDTDDFYRFVLDDSSQLWTFSLKLSELTSDVDIYVLDENWNTIWRGFNINDGTESWEGTLDPGIYYVWVYPYEEAQSDYLLTVCAEAFNTVKYALTLSSSAGGRVIEPNEGTFEFPEGEMVSLEAAAEPGYYFAGWSGSISDSNNPLTIVMNQDYDIEAEFLPVDSNQVLTVAVKSDTGTPISAFRYNVYNGLSYDSLKLRYEGDDYHGNWDYWVPMGYHEERTPFRYRDYETPHVSVEVIRNGNIIVGPVNLPKDSSVVGPIDIPIQEEGLYTIRCCATAQVEGCTEDVPLYPATNGKDEHGRYEVYRIERHENFYGGTYYRIWKRYTYQMILYTETYVSDEGNNQVLLCLPISEEYLTSIYSDLTSPILEYDTGYGPLTNETMKQVTDCGLRDLITVGGLAGLCNSLCASEVATVLVWFADPEIDLSEVMTSFLEDSFPETPIEPGLIELGISSVSGGAADFSLFGYTHVEALP